MKKVFLILCVVMFSMMLFSCSHTPITDVDNVTWRSDVLGLVITSEELHNPAHMVKSGKKSYSTITINDEKLPCIVCDSNECFFVYLYDIKNDTFISYYGNEETEEVQEFIYGFCSRPEKVEGKPYDYYFVLSLRKSCEYYDYCNNNNLVFPETITFYGYEN